MTAIYGPLRSDGKTPRTTVKVWDPFVRICHWSLVVLLILAFATGDELEGLHIAAGYAVAGLVGLRILWGFIGSPHARFSDFLHSPREVLAYLHDIVLGRAHFHIGHNPAGGAMIIALIALLVGVVFSGFMMTTGAYWNVDWVGALHEVVVYCLLGLVAGHRLGVLVASLEHRKDLVKARFTGRKRSQ
jgi:cytochrome b